MLAVSFFPLHHGCMKQEGNSVSFGTQLISFHNCIGSAKLSEFNYTADYSLIRKGTAGRQKKIRLASRHVLASRAEDKGFILAVRL